jgi:hypothetical protein
MKYDIGRIFVLIRTINTATAHSSCPLWQQSVGNNYYIPDDYRDLQSSLMRHYITNNNNNNNIITTPWL